MQGAIAGFFAWSLIKSSGKRQFGETIKFRVHNLFQLNISAVADKVSNACRYFTRENFFFLKKEKQLGDCCKVANVIAINKYYKHRAIDKRLRHETLLDNIRARVISELRYIHQPIGDISLYARDHCYERVTTTTKRRRRVRYLS